MDDQFQPTSTPSTSDSQMPEASVPGSTTARLSFSSIHNTLSQFQSQMKDVLTAENFERRLREKRRTLYTKYLEQEMGSLTSYDQLLHLVSHHPNLLDESSKNDVFRAIILDDVIRRVDEFEKDPIKNAEQKLVLVRSIYDAAEKVAPEIGGVTPEWAIRKRREIRGGLAREIIKNEANIPEVESYIAQFEQFEINRLHAGEVWKNGDIELARHLRQVMRERQKDDAAGVNEEKEPVQFQTVPNVSAPIIDTPPAYVALEPIVVPDVSPTMPPTVSTDLPPIRKDSSELNREIAGNIEYKLANAQNQSLGNYFSIAIGVKKGELPNVGNQGVEKSESEFSAQSEDFTIPVATPDSMQPDPGVVQEVIAQSNEDEKPAIEMPNIPPIEKDFVPFNPLSSVNTQAADPEPTLAQLIREDKELIETLEPHEKEAVPIVSSNQPPSLQEFSETSEQNNSQSSQVEEELPKKKKGFFSKLFGG